MIIPTSTRNDNLNGRIMMMILCFGVRTSFILLPAVAVVVVTDIHFDDTEGEYGQSIT